MRIGFLFNHDQIHQIAHSLPIALALANAHEDLEIVIATTSPKIVLEIVRLMGPDRPPAITLVGLGLQSRIARLTNGIFGKFFPAAKLLVYGDNLDFFRTLDALIVTERTSLILKTRYGLKDLLMILSDHGAGDRAIGFGKSTAQFDHILAAGQKIVDRLINEAGVASDRLTITGYPKFDYVGAKKARSLFADPHRPTVLYNPHVSPHLSSWYKDGRKVLEFFRENADYNLIFAPHIMLFQRRLVTTIDKLSFGLPGSLSARFASAPNIHVDLSSPALTDMTYTNMADVYLGDVSSQIYEFIKTPRPCLFLNSHQVKFENDENYAHWRLGSVIASVDELGAALACAEVRHKTHYRQVQTDLFNYTFDLREEPSSSRAAGVIARLLAERSGDAHLEAALASV